MARDFREARYPFTNKIKASNCIMTEFLLHNYEENRLEFDNMFTTIIIAHQLLHIMMHYFIKDATSCIKIEETYQLHKSLFEGSESLYMHIYQDSKLLHLLSTLLIHFKLIYGLFGQSNRYSTLDLCPRLARRNVPLHKRS